MAYEFFLSYARSNNDAYLIKFFDELSEQVRLLRGLPKDHAVAFIDQREEQHGDDWDAEIVEALQTSKVLIAMVSPGYFKGASAVREWALFDVRCRAAAPPGKTLPLVKPVIWIPLKDDDMPPGLKERHYSAGDPDAVQNKRGMRYVLRQLQEHGDEYVDLVEALAREIIDAADAHPLPRLPTVPKLQDVRVPPELEISKPGLAAAPVVIPSGPKHVRFVYVAASPQQFGNARVADPYVDVGGPDWKPFYPDSKARVHRFVQSIVANDDLDFTSDELPFGPNLLAEIDEAWRRRQIVVLLIDGWSLHWSADFRATLTQLDQRLDYHWCALLPWNGNDPDNVANRALIDAAIKQTFGRHQLNSNPLFYRSGIQSADELKAVLREVLVRLKEEIKKIASVDMPVPEGPPQAVVSGPSTRG
jgi:FxsC-like protein